MHSRTHTCLLSYDICFVLASQQACFLIYNSISSSAICVEQWIFFFFRAMDFKISCSSLEELWLLIFFIVIRKAPPLRDLKFICLRWSSGMAFLFLLFNFQEEILIYNHILKHCQHSDLMWFQVSSISITRTCWKCKFFASIPGFLNQKFWR